MTDETKDGIKIMKGVPIPNRVDRRSYPFHQLEVDECFIVECDDMKHERSVRSSATRYNTDGRRWGRFQRDRVNQTATDSPAVACS